MVPKFINILQTKTTIAAKYISKFNFSPSTVNNIANIAFPKKPDINIFISEIEKAINKNEFFNLYSLDKDNFLTNLKKHNFPKLSKYPPA